VGQRYNLIIEDIENRRVKMKNKKIIMLIIIIAIAPILVLLSIFNENFNSATRNIVGMIGFAIYIAAMIYSIWLVRSKKNKNN